VKKRVEAGALEVRLMARGEVLGAAAVAKAAERLARQPQAPGITAEPLANGVRLAGRSLKLRIVRDPTIGRVER
jgi:hypothetical protein